MGITSVTAILELAHEKSLKVEHKAINHGYATDFAPKVGACETISDLNGKASS